MKSNFLHNTLATALIGALAFGSMQASAATFSFSQHTGFDVSNTWLTSTDPVTPNNDIIWYEHSTGQTPVTGTYDTIAWGYPIYQYNNISGVQTGEQAPGLVSFDPFAVVGTSNQTYSGLRVTGFAGNVSTGADSWVFGEWEKITTLFHKNSAINSDAFTLKNSLIYSELYIGSYVDPHAIPITFTETLNMSALSLCLFGAPNNSLCDDLFTFPGSGLDSINFEQGGKNYIAEFKLGDFNNSVTNYPCGLPDCTVWTAENVTSDLSIFMRIREIPEPSSLALLGLALMGFGLRGRKAA